MYFIAYLNVIKFCREKESREGKEELQAWMQGYSFTGSKIKPLTKKVIQT